MRRRYPLFLIGAVIAFSLIVYDRLPERVPVHWGINGQPDRLGSRAEATLLLPVIMIASWALLRWLPSIDPKRANYAKFADTYELFVNSLLTLFAVMHVVVVGNALGWPVSVGRVVPALIGLLFMVLGNALPRARPNWWFGVRTPWTLSNDRVWMRTHRVAGYLLFGAGIVFVVAALVPSPLTFGLAVASIVAAGAGSIIYSYLAWKQENSR